MKTIGKNRRARLAPPILALVLAAPACGPGPGGDDDDTDTGTGEGPTCTWEQVYDQEAFWFQGFSADEVYSLTTDTILRWDGSSWAPFFLEKEGVQMSAPFIDNQRNFYFGTHSDEPGDCVLWKYDGSDWSCLWNETEQVYVTGTVWGTGEPNEVVCSTNGLSAQQSIYQYDPSGTWTEMWSGYGAVKKIWGRGPDDIYAIGSGFGDSHAMRYDGTGWKTLPPLPGIYYNTVSLLDIAADASGALWFAGRDRAGENEYPILAKFDGTTWEIVIDQDDVPEDPDDEGLYTGYLTGIHFFDDGKAVAVGRHLLYLYDGSSWTNVERVLQNGESHVLKNYYGLAVWGVSAQDFHVAVYASGIHRVSCE